jgi:hypothetical protein
MAFSSAPMIFNNYASAVYPGTCAANFLPTYFVDGLDSWWEVGLSADVADYIRSVLNSNYPMYDFRDADCNASTFKTYVYALQSFDTAVIYSKGHLAWQKCVYDYEHMGLAMYNGNLPSVWDTELYPLTSSSNVHSFIWHCRTAIMPDDYPNPGDCGYRRLPAAFTHDVNISLWGTSGSQVYLGWYNKENLLAWDFDNGQYYTVYNIWDEPKVGSPQYEWGIDPNFNYAQVACMYYYYLGQGYTTAQALVALAPILFNDKSYESSTLSGWLVAYGNMYVGLP